MFEIDQDTFVWIVFILVIIAYFIYKKYRKSTSSQEIENRNEILEKIMHSYGSVLEKVAKRGYTLNDENELPYEKELIKITIRQLFTNNMVAEEVKGHMASAYLELATFQSNVPDELKTEFPKNASDPQIVANLLGHPLYQKQLQERKELENDLKVLGVI